MSQRCGNKLCRTIVEHFDGRAQWCPHCGCMRYLLELEGSRWSLWIAPETAKYFLLEDRIVPKEGAK